MRSHLLENQLVNNGSERLVVEVGKLLHCYLKVFLFKILKYF